MTYDTRETVFHGSDWAGDGERLSSSETRLVREIAEGIIPDIPSAYKDNWTAITAGFVISPDGASMRNFCYVYDRFGHAGGFLIDFKGKVGGLLRLRELHADWPNRIWKKLLIQWGRQPEDLLVRFEFDDPYRWDVTTDNYRTQIRALRPAFALQQNA